MAEIGHNFEHSVGSDYDATSDAPVAGFVKLHPENDVDAAAPQTDNVWKQT